MKDNTNPIQNDTFENQDGLNEPRRLEIRGINLCGMIGKLKDDNNYFLVNKGDNF